MLPNWGLCAQALPCAATVFSPRSAAAKSHKSARNRAKLGVPWMAGRALGNRQVFTVSTRCVALPRPTGFARCASSRGASNRNSAPGDTTYGHADLEQKIVTLPQNIWFSITDTDIAWAAAHPMTPRSILETESASIAPNCVRSCVNEALFSSWTPQQCPRAASREGDGERRIRTMPRGSGRARVGNQSCLDRSHRGRAPFR
jgi:hypothetical protein